MKISIALLRTGVTSQKGEMRLQRNYNMDNAKKMGDYEFRLKEGKRWSVRTVETKMRYVNEFDIFLNGIDFKAVDNKIAASYREHLRTFEKNGNHLLLKTINNKLLSVIQFFIWLKKEDGYKIKIKESILDYFELSNQEKKTILTKRNLRKFPSLDHILELISSIQGGREVDLRDSGLISLLMLTGIRDGTLINLQIKDLDIREMIITVDPETGGTPKGGVVSYIIIPEFEKVLVENFLKWVNYLTSERNFSPQDPIFPKTDNKIPAGSNLFAGDNVTNEFWRSTGSISAMLKRRFKAAGLEYYSPHTLRSSSYQILRELASTPEEMAAIWQNMGHSNSRVSEIHYGILPINLRKKNIDNIVDVANSEELSQDDKFENFKKEVKEELKNGISKGFQEFLKLLPKNNGGDDKEEK